MKKSKYNILVLSDLKDSNNQLLKSAVSLSKKIDGHVQFFHVKKPTDIVERESQLSTFRSINEQHTKTKKSIEELVSSVHKTYDIKVDYSYTFGNVKNEIGDYISKNKPDIIILGNRKPKPISLLGDSITEFVLNTHKGAILIANNDHVLEPNKDMSIGVLNGELTLLHNEFPKELLEGTNESLKIFSFTNNQIDMAQENQNEQTKTVEYVFEHNDNTINNLSKYVLKSNINLLLIDRNKKENKQKNTKQIDVKNIIDKLNVSLLISSQK